MMVIVPCLCACSWCAVTVMCVCVCVVCDLHCVIVEVVCVCVCVVWCIHNCLASCCAPIRGSIPPGLEGGEVFCYAD